MKRARKPVRADRLIALGAALLFVAACASSASPSYFPLEAGKVWDYRITRIVKGETQTQRLMLASLSPVEIDGERYYRRRRLDDRIELFRDTPEGLVRIDPAGRATRVLPAEQAPGTRWEEPTRVFFLEVTGAFAETFRERARQSIPLEFVVESDSDTVKVAAGTYTNCLRVKSTGSTFAGRALKEYMGISFIKVDQTEWYAPGVGLVKRVRKEHTTPAKWSNEYIEELLAVD
jgi:hypothetical protein